MALAYASGSTETSGSQHGISTEVTTVRASEVERLLSEWAYEGQRPVYPSHVLYLAGAIGRGELTSIEVHLGVADGSGFDVREYLVDGQHRLHALARFYRETGIDRVLPMIAIRHSCDGDAALATLYGVFDRGRGRSFGDIFNAMKLGDEIGLTPTEVRYVGQATPLLLSEFGPTNTNGADRVRAHSATVRAAEIREWSGEGRAFFDAVRGATSEVSTLIRKSAVLPVALVTLRFQGDRARQFWGSVASQESTAEGDPAFTLLTFLRNVPLRRHAPWVYSRYVAVAWNAFYSGARIGRLVVKRPDLPILILGSTQYGDFNRRKTVSGRQE